MAAIDRINNIVTFMQNTWGIDVLAGKEEQWAQELESGTGRTYEELREDIFLNYVGMDKLTAYVQQQFDSRGIPLTEGTDETADERLARIVNELVTGTRTFESLGDSLDKAVATKEETATQEGTVGAANRPTGIMSGGELITLTDASGNETYAMRYDSGGGIYHIYTFDSYEQVEQVLGPNPRVGPDVSYESVIDPETNSFIVGSAVGLTDQPDTSYQVYFDNLMGEAAIAAGVRDPNRLSQLYRDPAVQKIIALAAEAGWTDEQEIAEIRRTQAYLDLYPGIDTILESGSADPEGDWRRYYNSVNESLRALGYEPDENGNFDTQVGQMLSQGITAGEFNEFTPVFVRAQQSEGYADALNQWVQADTGRDLTFDEWFDVLAGTTTPEMDAIVEKAMLQYRSNLSSTALTTDQLNRIAEQTQLSEQQVALAFSNAEEALLSVGQPYLERYGLSEEALVNAAFDVSTGDFSAVEVRRQAQKAATELGIQDDRKAQFFVGFDSFGRPRRQGLGASAPEAG